MCEGSEPKVLWVTGETNKTRRDLRGYDQVGLKKRDCQNKTLKV